MSRRSTFRKYRIIIQYTIPTSGQKLFCDQHIQYIHTVDPHMAYVYESYTKSLPATYASVQGRVACKNHKNRIGHEMATHGSKIKIVEAPWPVCEANLMESSKKSFGRHLEKI